MTRKQIPATPTENVLYVLDGRDILSKLLWKKGETYQHIYQRYINYVTVNCGENAEIVFDGYHTEPKKRQNALEAK